MMLDAYGIYLDNIELRKEPTDAVANATGNFGNHPSHHFGGVFRIPLNLASELAIGVRVWPRMGVYGKRQGWAGFLCEKVPVAEWWEDHLSIAVKLALGADDELPNRERQNEQGCCGVSHSSMCGDGCTDQQNDRNNRRY
jgi:hypothetical protein